jgi:hypothetical protein
VASGEWKSIRYSQFATRKGHETEEAKPQVVVPAFSLRKRTKEKNSERVARRMG